MLCAIPWLGKLWLLMTMRKNNSRQGVLTALFEGISTENQSWKGYLTFLISLLALSFLSAANFESAPKIYLAGDIAESDVIADRELTVEDTTATEARIKQHQALQPPIYDYSMAECNQFKNNMEELFKVLASGERNFSNPVLAKFASEIGRSTAEEILPVLVKPQVQKYFLQKLLPRIIAQNKAGLPGDVNLTRLERSGILIRNLETNEETLRPDINSLLNSRSFLAELSSQLRHAPELTGQDRTALNTLLDALLPVSLTYNQEASRQSIEAAITGVSPVFYTLKKGEMFIRKGERVSREQALKLANLYRQRSEAIHWDVVAGAFAISLIFSLGLFIVPTGKRPQPLHRKDLYLISVIILFAGLAAKGFHIFGLQMDSPIILQSCGYAFPVAGFAGLGTMLLSGRRYATLCLLVSFFTVLIFNETFLLFLYYFLGGMLATWLLSRSQNRSDIVWNVIPLGIGLTCIAGSVYLISPSSQLGWIWLAGAALVCSLLSLIILFTVTPVLELIFGYGTRFRLMELMNLEQPLMQEIMVSIPGTYHHSLVVANMVEAGAKAIGANSLLCKVAALYHDAGKLSYPDYFIENQFGAPNKHDRLSPSMSALILHSHVKKGTELAEKYNLGQEISDIIRQHHGTRMMRFFYQKAVDLGENPNESDYCYPGPKPQTKEAAILMLADSVEASSRTLTDPTPARIKNHIDNIIKGIFSEGQLDESELTFRDLHYLSETFQRILTGIFHQRIVYPDNKVKNSSTNDDTHQQPKDKSAQETPKKP